MLLTHHLKAACLGLLAMIVLTSCSSKSEDLRIKQAGLYFAAGTQSLVQGEYTDALKNLLEANKLDPNNPELLTNLGMAYYFKGEEAVAIKMLQQVLKINPANSDASNNLASIYYRNGDYVEAERLYKKVLADLTYDKQARTYFNLGLIENEIHKNSVAAEKYFKKSIDEDENYCPSFHELGLIQFRRRQFNSALRRFKEASQGVCYESPAPLFYQALTLIELRKYEDARIKLEEFDTRFAKSSFASKARAKVIEINDIENRRSSESHASRKVLESPDF